MLYHEVYTISEQDLDELGHMNYLRYIQHFERTRFAFLEQAGYSMDALAEQQLGTVILKLETEYLRELRLGQAIDIYTKISRVGTKSFTFEQEMQRQGELCAKTKVVLTVMDLQERKAIIVPEKLAQLLQ